jgi:hypothetical protein
MNEMSDKAHYEQMFSDCTAAVGASLAAKAVYAARHGDADLADIDVLRELTRGLIAHYGETLSAEQVRAEMARA